MFVAILMLLSFDAPATAVKNIGDRVSKIQFKDIRYLRRGLDDLGPRKATVLYFITNQCPLVQRTWPTIKEIEKKFRKDQVRFVAINVGEADEIREVARQAIDFGISFPFMKDENAQVAATLGVLHVPTVVVLDSNNVLCYRGRVDDRIRLGGERTKASRDDLVEAINDVLAGKPVRVSETPVDGCAVQFPTPSTPRSLTYAKDVAPIITKECQECHRSGGAAPFSLTSYRDVAAHASTIAEVALDGRMPPWYGSNKAKFSNHKALTDEEKQIISDWVRGGRVAGDLSKAPEPMAPAKAEWTIGKPDRVIRMVGKHEIPATGIVEYKYPVLPTVFTHDVWVQGVEIHADNPAVLHHCNLGYINLGGNIRRPKFITGKVPGGQAMILEPGVAFRIPKGAVLGLQAHYTTTGKPESCVLSVGLRYARGIVKKELRHLQIANTNFTIPPNETFHEVSAERVLPVDALGVGMFAHMHLRATDMTFRAKLPTGAVEELLCIPNYNFDWQQAYVYGIENPKKLPKGTRIRCTAHYDNSQFNPFNPDPSAEVLEGQQTTDEMLFGFFFYVAEHENLNLSIDPKTGAIKNN